MDYLCYEQPPGGFPAPRIQVRAQRWRSATPWRQGSVVSRSPLRAYRRARYALHAALCQAGVQAGDAVLVPAYHCLSLLDPVLRTGARPLFYPVGEDLRPQLPPLEALLRSGQARVLLLSHLFGIDADVSHWHRLCRETGTVLIEDCAHLLAAGGELLAQPERAALGQLGDFAVSSPSKFAPSLDGGWLWARDPAQLPEALPRPSWARELRSALALLQAPAPSVRQAQPAGPGRTQQRQWSGPSSSYQPSDETLQSLRLSQRLWCSSAWGASAARRRAHAERWQRLFEGLPSLRSCVDNVARFGPAPYMVPVLVENAEPLFTALKQQGFPLGRWDCLADTGCALAERLRERLFHLPCHADLSDADMEWLCSTFKRLVLSA